VPELDEAITTYLLARTGLTALIGRRFSFDEPPKDTTLPYVVCKEISNVFNDDMDGKIENENPNWQWTVYAVSRESAKAVGRQLRAALQDYSGTLSGITVQKIKLRFELQSKEMIGDTQSVHTLDQEYQIYFENEE
jgi:hypothetical protein